MKSYLAFIFLLLILSCEILRDIEEYDGPCTIILVDGSSVVSNGNIEISERTRAITYRDENGKIWSLFKEDYESYSCN